MKIIFLKTVAGQAEIGEIRSVRPGYARNYLIPSGLAELATAERVTNLEGDLAKLKATEEKEEAAASSLRERLEKLTLTFRAEAGDDGTLFGTVTKQDIAERLAELSKTEIDRHALEFDPPRALGDYETIYKVSPAVHATIKVKVVRKGGVSEGPKAED